MKALVLLLILAAAPVLSEDLVLDPQPPPGTYTDNVTVHAQSGPGQNLSFRFLESGETFRPWTDDLRLTALPGEKRLYHLRLSLTNPQGESLVRDFDYLIQRPAPRPPLVTPAPTYSNQALVLNSTPGPDVTVSLDGQPVSFPLTLDAPAGTKRDFRLVASSKTQSFPDAVWNYEVDKRGVEAPVLEVLSPQPGSWSNNQLLALRTAGLDHVVWSWGSSLDEKNSEPYIRPGLLEPPKDANGSLQLTVSGRSRLDGTLVQKTISWQAPPGNTTPGGITPAYEAKGWPDSFWGDRSLDLPVPEAGTEVSVDGKTWRPMTTAIHEGVRAQGLKVLTYWVRPSAQVTPARYFYVLDDRRFAVPTSRFWGGGNSQLSFWGPEDLLYSVSWNNAKDEATMGEALRGPAVTWNVPVDAVTASVQTLSPAGVLSPPEVFDVGPSGFQLPQWKADSSGGSLSFPRGMTPVYEVSQDGSPQVPSETSPVAGPTLTAEVPEGGDRKLTFLFALTDASGKVGPVTPPVEIPLASPSQTQSPVLRFVEQAPAPTASEAPADQAGQAQAPAQVKGVPADGLSREAIVLSASASSGTVRYELVEGDLSAPPVGPFSPAFPDQLNLNVQPGLDRNFHLQVQTYSPNGLPISAVQTIDLRVDRLPPDQPQPTLALETRRPEVTARFSATDREPGGRLYYRWSWSGFPSGQGNQDWTPVDGDSVTFRAPGDNLTNFRFEAVSEDQAGNRSTVFSKDVLLDQNVVYLSAATTTAADPVDGSRTHPYRLLDDALKALRDNGKHILFLATGSYTMSQKQDVTNLAIWGGLSDSQWESTGDPGRSVIAPASSYTDASFFSAYQGTLEIHHLETQASTPVLDSQWDLHKTQVRSEDCVWTSAGAGDVWRQDGGSLVLLRGAGSLADSQRGSFLRLKGTDFRVTGLDLSAQRNLNSQLFDVQSSKGTFSDLVVVSQKGQGVEEAVHLDSSEVLFNNLRVLAGEGSPRAAALDLVQSKTTLFDADLTLYGSLGNAGLQVTGGHLEMQGFSLTLASGSEFNQGLISRQAVVVLDKGQIKLIAGAYQSGLTQQEGHLEVTATSIELAGGGKNAWGAQFLGVCEVVFKDNSWILTQSAPGSCWILEKGWTKTSQENNNRFDGWKTVVSSR